MKHGFTAMMNYDDRFDFPKFELPNVWLTFIKGGGGTFKGTDGKMKLEPGHSLAKRFPDKVASKAEMEERKKKLDNLAGKDNTKDDTQRKVAKMLTSQDIRSAYYSIPEGKDGFNVRIADLKEKLGGNSEDVDSLLKSMMREGKISLRRLEDPRGIKPRDEAAAIDMGGGDKRYFVRMRR